MLSRILSSTKIVKVEGRKPNLFEFYAEPHPIFYKDSERLIFDRRTKEQNFMSINFKSVLLSNYSLPKCDLA